MKSFLSWISPKKSIVNFSASPSREKIGAPDAVASSLQEVVVLIEAKSVPSLLETEAVSPETEDLVLTEVLPSIRMTDALPVLMTRNRQEDLPLLIAVMQQEAKSPSLPIRKEEEKVSTLMIEKDSLTIEEIEASREEVHVLPSIRSRQEETLPVPAMAETERILKNNHGEKQRYFPR